MNLNYFSELSLYDAGRQFFQSDCLIPVKVVQQSPVPLSSMGLDNRKETPFIENVWILGLVDDEAFEGVERDEDALTTLRNGKGDYPGIVFVAIELQDKEYARGFFAQITRYINRHFKNTPVAVLFKYNKLLTFANIERTTYKQEWREGEKVGKVSILRDINLDNIHRGHIDILKELRITSSGAGKTVSEGGLIVKTLDDLYKHWQNVLSISLLNKTFYKDIQNWYFWAIKNVTFPGMPTAEIAHIKNKNLDDLVNEHKATNVIRLLTRLLFIWFIKEKKLIPDDLFELDVLQKDILNEFSPFHEKGMFVEANKESIYYKAILQNLFFATLNCPIKPEKFDQRQRGFRGDGYGTHRGVDYLMRYKKYFKNPEKFLKLMNDTVPFLNGGLFECLDDKFNNIFIDGFSDQMTSHEKLIVPDFLFFGVDEEVDLSDVIGFADRTTRNSAVKGLINILKSYKFTITENTPIEEDVALDPELLGKVFENLLASYNPETKTTARKQTGSFYTPREIVNYMVDESLKEYMKQSVAEVCSSIPASELDKELNILLTYSDSQNPFDKQTTKALIKAINDCKILDPACGSGAFPMGVLQKMVHLLQKLDPDNSLWKEIQIQKAETESKAAFEIEDKQARADRLLEINEAFDMDMNDPDYARKLFLIENCIYGVDIQPIATQISKLRFFISLVVEQKVNPDKQNFGIRALPNLETRFVAANTLIDIEKPKEGETMNIFSGGKIDELERELKIIRKKLFSARSKETKLKYRDLDKKLRNEIAQELKNNNWNNDSADKLAGWDPYDQNASSPFFNAEWMFDIKVGFDIVIGNPPYGATTSNKDKLYYIDKYQSAKTIRNVQKGSTDTFTVFIENGFNNLKTNGNLVFIVPISITSSDSMTGLHRLLESNCSLIKVSSYAVRPQPVFENAVVNTSILFFVRDNKKNTSLLATKMYRKNKNFNLQHLVNNLEFIDVQDVKLIGRYPKISSDIEKSILKKILNQRTSIGDVLKQKGKLIFYRFAGGRYYKVITNYSTGSSAERAIYFDKKIANSIGAILSSNLYFWFYQIFSDNLNLKAYEIESFGLPIEKFSDEIISKLEDIYSKYLKDIEQNANVRQTTRYANIDSFKEYKIGLSKHIIDQIDDIIGPLYGLTKEEIEFIKNYEIEYRICDGE